MDTLILLVYVATGCLGCNSYVNTVNNAVIAASQPNCCSVRTINVVEEPPYQVRQITKIPTVIMINPDGTEIARLNNYTSVTTLVNWINFNSN